METDKSVQCGYYQARQGQQIHPSRIPLKHIDQIKSSVKQMIKIDVTIQIDNKFGRLFDVDGNAPVYVSSLNLDDQRIKNVDIRLGDYIVMVNDKNVSRAVTQSVRKIIKSSKTLQMTLYRSDKPSSLIQQHQSSKSSSKFNSFWSGIWNSVIVGGNKKTPIIPSCIINNLEIEDNESDHGYCSIPRTSVSSLPRTQCSSSSSSGIVSDLSEVENKLSAGEVINKFKSECDYFLHQLQQAVDVYVRPSMALNILTINECFNLYQNIEKLVPVTRFMTNVLFSSNESQSCLPNADMLKIVFDSFKTYLLGLPSAINLLADLTSQNESFVEFLDNIGHQNSFKILDLLFMPLNFVKLMVEFLRGVQKIVENGDENDSNELRFKLIIADLYECSVHTYQVLEEVFEKNANHEDEWSEMSSLAASIVPYDTENTPVSVKFDGCDNWLEGRLCLNSMQIDLDDIDESIKLATSSHIKKSKCGNLFYLKAKHATLNQDTFLVVKLDSRVMRNYVFEKISCLVF